MSRTLLASASILALSSLAWPGIAGAQQKEETTVLEPITVTATKRVQEAFEVPATVAIVEAQELQDRGIASAGELDRAFVDTNIRSRSNRAYTNVTVRGQSSVDYYEPSVQLYVDGLPQDPSIFSQLLPAGLDSVELLYGPQGTLYGRGAIGGVINVVTRKPDNELRVDTAGALHTQGGDASLLLNTPIIDGVIYGDAALTFRREADQYTLLGSGQEIGGTDDLNGRIRLRYAPDDSPLDVMVSTQRGRVDSTEEQFVMESMFNDRIALPIDSRYRLDTASFGVNASYDLDFATITALTGYQDRKLDRTTLGFQTPEDQTTFSQELRIASDPELGNALDYVVGVYGQRLDFERRTPLIGQVSQQTIDSYAIFGDLAWHATDRLDISPGLRFDYEKARARADGAVTIAGERSFGGVSPKLGASYALDDEWRVHGLFSTGYKAGGFTRNVTPENIAYSYHALTRAVNGKMFSIMRDAVQDVLLEAVGDRTDLRYGTTVTALANREDGVDVVLSTGSTESFDIVVGADGWRSAIRQMCFGPHETFLRPLGFRAAAWRMPLATPLDSSFVGMMDVDHQGGLYEVGDGTAATLFCWRDSSTGRVAPEARQKTLMERFGQWSHPVSLALSTPVDWQRGFFDTIAQIEVPRWSSGRVVLLGDAAWCLTFLSGQGTSTALAGAWILASELAAKPHAQAFEAYESRLKPMVTRMQATSRRIGGHFVPESKLGLRIQSWTLPLLLSRPFAGFLARRMSAEELELDVP